MATLAPSLKLLFAELDSHWPNRDRRTDGAIRPPSQCGRRSDHCADSRGRVHAIDIDKDGINPDWVCGQILSKALPTKYVIWNRRIAERHNNFRWVKYTGTSNPHTDHIHVSILSDQWAWEYRKGWYIAKERSGFGPAPEPAAVATDWNFRPQVDGTADWLYSWGNGSRDTANGIKGLRR